MRATDDKSISKYGGDLAFLSNILFHSRKGEKVLSLIQKPCDSQDM